MESHIPPDPLHLTAWRPSLVKPDVASLVKPMVDLPLRQAHANREKVPHLENDGPSLSTIKLMRISPSGRSNENEGDGGPATGVKVAREFSDQEIKPSFLPHKEEQPSN